MGNNLLKLLYNESIEYSLISNVEVPYKISYQTCTLWNIKLNTITKLFLTTKKTSYLNTMTLTYFCFRLVQQVATFQVLFVIKLNK